MHRWIINLFEDVVVSGRTYTTPRTAMEDIKDLKRYYPELSLRIVPTKSYAMQYPVLYTIEVNTSNHQFN